MGIPAYFQEKIFRQIYSDLIRGGVESAPRGMPVIELLAYKYVLPPRVRFANFASRKLSIDYIKKELQWYLKGDPTDLSICDHASIWKDCVTNGVLHSNYGQYWFGPKGLRWVVETLVDDRDSRRAVIPMLSKDHLFHENKDVPCTAYISFMIRSGILVAHVHMRSQDAVYGLGNDVPAFSILQELVWGRLRQTYQDLELGSLTVIVDSFHVYEKHWMLAGKMATNDPFKYIGMPELSGPEEAYLILTRDSNDNPGLLETFCPINLYRWIYG